MLPARLRRRNRDDASVDMTPMLDIVFIMLIFFIVTATFLDETGLDIAPPPPSTQHTQPQKSIQVYVDAKNQITVDRDVAELSAVPLRVERLLAEKPDAGIVLKAHAQAPLNTVVYIKDQMNLAGRDTLIKVEPLN